MPKVKFAIAEVDEKFEATGDKDVTIHIGKHHGPLSKISLATAEALIKVKDANIKAKDATAVNKPTAE